MKPQVASFSGLILAYEEKKWQKIFAGVREHGSYKRYLRAPHREFLRFRSLLVRGRAKTNGLNERIARLPNGACWKVLSYWREDK